MKKMFSFIIVTMILTIPVFSTQKVSASTASNSLSITSTMPNNGGVTLDDDGKVIEATDTSLLDSQAKNNNARGAQYIQDGHWTYGVETWPQTAWENKKAFSNFNHYKKYHTATAKVGTKSSRVGANANKYAYATVTGKRKDSATAYYNY